tara:strand:- start:903 stop:1058 length:156 start_codon:yes stop_codon:yes gene_type:complete
MSDEEPPYVTRFEVIDHNGRSYTNHTVGTIEFSLQDNGRTLKVFLSQTKGE